MLIYLFSLFKSNLPGNRHPVSNGGVVDGVTFRVSLHLGIVFPTVRLIVPTTTTPAPHPDPCVLVPYRNGDAKPPGQNGHIQPGPPVIAALAA